jgi:hypothetical protein
MANNHQQTVCRDDLEGLMKSKAIFLIAAWICGWTPAFGQEKLPRDVTEIL